jgi:peptidoglycan/xylan/chitin deacetylase (PgdA/CDA1 family)
MVGFAYRRHTAQGSQPTDGGPSVRVPGLPTARRLAHWLRTRAGARALVLGYHRIDDAAHDPYGLCTSPERFRAHLQVLREEAAPVRMDALIDGLGRGSLPRRAALVTIDDGYADAFQHAKPALEDHAIAATVFVTTGVLDSVPWWEALAAAFPLEGSSAAVALPDRLSIDVEGRQFGWAPPAPPESARDVRGSRIQQVHRILVDWPQPQRDRAIERLAGELGSPVPADRVPRGLSRAELSLLAESDVVEIGAHGVHHPRLASLPEETQRFEIAESKRILEDLLGRPLHAFSYPNGSSAPRTRELVRESGYACAFGSHSGVAAPAGDPYLLPRFWAGQMEPEALRRLVRYWG